jgi:glycosyltransferase involved in cell wall biosynthesis
MERATLPSVPPRLTVITPTLNQAAFIERTITSVLDQGYEDLEYLVVDGGSTDGTIEIIKRYADRIAWWVSEPDDGQTDALNKALSRATGDVVAFINSDDHYLPGAFAAAMRTLEEHPDAWWATGAARFVDADGRTEAVWHARRPPRHRHLWLLLPWSAPQPSTFWRRRVFDELGPFRRDMHYVFDTEFALRLAYAGHLPAIVPGELSVRVLHPEAKSWDLAPFRREQDRFLELFGPSLTLYEQMRLRLTRLLISLRIPQATGAASRLWRRALRRPVPKAWTAPE